MVITVAVAVWPAVGQLRFAPAAVVSLMTQEPPHWINYLADLMQIATPLVAIVVWGTSRLKRR